MNDCPISAKRADSMKRHLMVAACFLAIIVLAKWNTFDLPYHWDEGSAYILPTHYLVEDGLVRVLPGFRDPFEFYGRPPAWYLSLTLCFRAFGERIVVARLFILLFSFLGVFFTYLIGCRLLRREGGVFAGLLLLSTPLYFAQSGLAQGDLPITALGVMAVYFGLRRWLLPYLVAASVMVLMKETALAVVVATGVYVGWRDWKRSGWWQRTVPYFVPGLVLLAFILWQKVATGHFVCNPYFHFNRPLSDCSWERMTTQAGRVVDNLFRHQGRKWLTLAILGAGLFKGRRLWRPEYALFLLVLLFFGAAFSLLYYMPRYLLPAFPFLCLIGAGSFTAMRRSVRKLAVLGVLIAFWFSLAGYGSPGFGNHDESMEYAEVVEVSRRACRALEAQDPQLVIRTSWPLTHALTYPFLGYVSRPIRVVDKGMAFDRFLHVPDWQGDTGLPDELAGKLDLERTFKYKEKYLKLYRKRSGPDEH